MTVTSNQYNFLVFQQEKLVCLQFIKEKRNFQWGLTANVHFYLEQGTLKHKYYIHVL